jgi:hypothetical protein
MGMPPRVEVQYTEAVLLNSLKYLMVSVPGMEETLLEWCQATDHQAYGMVPTGKAMASPQQHLRGNVAAMIGVQFDQVPRAIRNIESIMLFHAADMSTCLIDIQTRISLVHSLGKTKVQVSTLCYVASGCSQL